MKRLGAIREIYEEVHEFLAEIPEPFIETGGTKVGVNGCAYFSLLFAAFERAIDLEYDQVVGERYKCNRCGTQRPSFMERVRALRPDDASEIGDYYQLRCDIAHGRTFADLNLPIAPALGVNDIIGQSFDDFEKWTADYGEL